MNDQPASANPNPSMRGPWIAWIVASTLLPALPFILLGRKGDSADGTAFIALALICQLGCSIWLAFSMAQKLRKGPGHVVLFTIVFMIASVIVGCVSFFAACAAWGATPNFH